MVPKRRLEFLAAMALSVLISLFVAAYQRDYIHSLRGEESTLPFSRLLHSLENFLFDSRFTLRFYLSPETVEPVSWQTVRDFHLNKAALSEKEIKELTLRERKIKKGLGGDFRHLNKIVIVALDDDSKAELMSEGLGYIRRTYYAQLIRLLKQAGAKVVAFDMLFDLKSLKKEDDIEFAKAIKEVENTVLGCRWEYLGRSEKSNKPSFAFVSSYNENFDTVLAALPDLPYRDGLVNALEDPVDKSIRLGTLLGAPMPGLGESPQYEASLAAQAVAHYLGISPEKLIADLEKGVFNGKALPLIDFKNVSDEQVYRAVIINYAGLRRTFLHVPLNEVFRRTPKELQTLFEGKIVFVGDTSKMAKDYFPTPFDTQLPGVEIHANIAQGLLSNNFIRPASDLTNSCFIVGMGLAAGVAAYFLHFYGLIPVLGAAIAFGFLSYWLFVYQHLWVLAAYPLLNMVLNFVGGTAYRNLTVERRSKHLRRRYGRFVAPRILKAIEEHPENVLAKPQRHTATLLFTDLQGFTTLSETREPDQVVEILNEHFELMFRIIDEHGGTVNKLIGDAIFAMWGAPFPQEDHALLAVQCAVRMQIKMEELRESLRARGLPELFMRIGIHTGQPVVGGVGSSRQQDYTAIGDAVNVAARLEPLNKQFGSWVLISEMTYELVKDAVVAEEVGETEIRGRARPMKVYKLLGLSSGERVPEAKHKKPPEPVAAAAKAGGGN